MLLSRLRHRYVVPPEFGNTYRREIGDIFWDLNPKQVHRAGSKRRKMQGSVDLCIFHTGILSF